MNRYFYSLLSLFFVNTSLSAQAQTVSIETVSGCAGQEVLVPVIASNLFDVGSITFFIGFDAENLSFLSLENIDPQLSDMNYICSSDPSQLAVAWSNINGAYFPQTKFFDIKFSITGETTPVIFNPGFEIADVSLQVLQVTPQDGSVELANPAITTQPIDAAINTGMTVAFQLVSPDATGFSWQESHDLGNTWSTLQNIHNYSGTHTRELTISNVPKSFNQLFYRCICEKGICNTISNLAKLTVDSITLIPDQTKIQQYYLQNQPNPFSEYTKITYYIPEDGNVQLSIVDLLGNIVSKLVSEPQTKGHHSIDLHSSGIADGLYLCKLEFRNGNTRYSNYHKLIKN